MHDHQRRLPRARTRNCAHTASLIDQAWRRMAGQGAALREKSVDGAADPVPLPGLHRHDGKESPVGNSSARWYSLPLLTST
jgi:hypothetical protein